MGKVPLQVLGRISLPLTLRLPLLRLPLSVTLLWRSVRSVSSLLSKRLKTRFRRVPILKKHKPGCENTCGYFEVLNKRILIQQRALACRSKSLAHIFQRELYTMGNTGLLRWEAEMTLLQPHLGDSRRQELGNSPFWPTPLFKSQLVKNGEDFLLKKAPLKNHSVLDPIKISPHHNKKRGSYWGTHLEQASTKGLWSDR